MSKLADKLLLHDQLNNTGITENAVFPVEVSFYIYQNSLANSKRNIVPISRRGRKTIVLEL